jgi:intracellular sulfur oxidation DsrE/DsrF family protein
MRHVVLVLAALLATPAFGQSLPKAVPSAGIPAEIPGAKEKPDPALAYRILFDISALAKDKATPHHTLQRAGAMLNAMVASGVTPAAGSIAIVVHGPPDSILLTDAAHMKRFGEPNPNRLLLEELANAGVSIRICGQSYLARGYGRDELHPAVQLDLMAMITIANLMARGYGVVRDN